MSVGITTGVAVGTGVSVGGGTGVPVGSGVGVSAGRSVGVGSGVGVSVGGITTGVGTTISPLSTSGSSRNSFFSSSSSKTGFVGSSSFLAVLFCSSFMSCLPNLFSSSHSPLKQFTSVSPRSLSCSTLIIVPLGDAVPAGVTMRKGRLSDSTPSSKRKIFPSSNSMIVSWFTPNCPKRQTVSGVVLIIRRKSWTRMSTRASLWTKVLTPSPGTRFCPISAGAKTAAGADASLGLSVSTRLVISSTVMIVGARAGLSLPPSRITNTTATITAAITTPAPARINRPRFDLPSVCSLTLAAGAPSAFII